MFLKSNFMYVMRVIKLIVSLYPVTQLLYMFYGNFLASFWFLLSRRTKSNMPLGNHSPSHSHPAQTQAEANPCIIFLWLGQGEGKWGKRLRGGQGGWGKEEKETEIPQKNVLCGSSIKGTIFLRKKKPNIFFNCIKNPLFEDR